MTMSNAHSGDLESAQSVEPVWHQLPESSIDRFGWVLQTQIRSLQQISVTYYSFACQVGWFLPESTIAPFHACPRNYAGDCLCSISGCVGNAMTDILVLLRFAKQHTGLICWEAEEKHTPIPRQICTKPHWDGCGACIGLAWSASLHCFLLPPLPKIIRTKPNSGAD